MSLPAARIGDLTATGDVITGPGAPDVIIGNRPAARATDLVAGPACTGAIAAGSAMVLIGNLPAARVSDAVAGVNASGAAVSTVIAPPGTPDVLIGD